jgi:hypothetical protein
MRLERIVEAKAWGTALVGVACAIACASPNTYGTARTIPKGKVSHTAAVEFIGVNQTTGDTDGDGVVEGGVSVFFPTFPAYQVRYGVSDSVEFGARVASAATVGADLKVNFLRDSVVDLAVDPGFQYLLASEISIGYLYLPLLIDLNVSEVLSFVLTPGAMFAAGFGGIDNSAEFSNTGPMIRAGLGLNIRPSEKFALQPELTIMKPLDRGDSLTTLIYSAGIGFNFSNLPDFSDVD